MLLTGLPLLALTQPFLGGFQAPLLFGLLLVALGVALWRGAADLQVHVRAGAQAVVEALVAQSRKGRLAANARVRAPATPADALSPLHTILPGLGAHRVVQRGPGCAADSLHGWI